MALVERIPALLRERTFRRYWTGQTISLVGDQISLIAIPLAAVLILGADAAEMGWLKTAELLPALLLNLPLGAWADRQARRRRVMIVADLGRAALMLTLPVAYALDALTLGQLYAVAFGIGALTVLFEVCNATLIVALVPTERYVQANSLVNGSRSMSWLAGPGIGGVLVQVLTAPFALVADALTYVVSVGYLARVKAVEPPCGRRGQGALHRGDALGGPGPFDARAVLRLRHGPVLQLHVPHPLRALRDGRTRHRRRAARPGPRSRCGGRSHRGRVQWSGRPADRHRRLARHRLPRVHAAPAPDTPGKRAAAAGGGRVLRGGVPLLRRGDDRGHRRGIVPDGGDPRCDTGPGHGRVPHAQPRLPSLGALAGGLLGTAIGLRPTLWIATGGAVLAVLWLLPSPLARMRELPTKGEESTPVGAL